MNAPAALLVIIACTVSGCSGGDKAKPASPGTAAAPATPAPPRELPAPDPARGQPVAWVRDRYIYPSDLQATELGALIGRPLMQDFVREHHLEPTEAELARCERFLAKTSPGDGPEETAARKQIAQSFVSQWKLNKALYEKYGGTVIFQQMDPLEPVGAYRKFFEEREARADFKIFDAAEREKFWHYYTREHPMQVPKDEIDFSKPWWERLNDR